MDIFSDTLTKLKAWGRRLRLWNLVVGAVEGVQAGEAAPQWEGESEEEDLPLWEGEACQEELFELEHFVHNRLINLVSLITTPITYVGISFPDPILG